MKDVTLVSVFSPIPFPQKENKWEEEAACTFHSFKFCCSNMTVEEKSECFQTDSFSFTSATRLTAPQSLNSSETAGICVQFTTALEPYNHSHFILKISRSKYLWHSFDVLPYFCRVSDAAASVSDS